MECAPIGSGTCNAPEKSRPVRFAGGEVLLLFRLRVLRHWPGRSPAHRCRARWSPRDRPPAIPPHTNPTKARHSSREPDPRLRRQ